MTYYLGRLPALRQSRALALGQPGARCATRHERHLVAARSEQEMKSLCVCVCFWPCAKRRGRVRVIDDILCWPTRGWPSLRASDDDSIGGSFGWSADRRIHSKPPRSVRLAAAPVRVRSRAGNAHLSGWPRAPTWVGALLLFFCT